MSRPRRLRRWTCAGLLLALSVSAVVPPRSEAREQVTAPVRATPAQLAALLAYIRRGWRTLSRTNRGLARAAVDPKFPPLPSGRRPVYVSRAEHLPAVARRLRVLVPPAEFAQVELRRLPPEGEEVTEHGLLYLPRPYVVPGGRFNEMYGWDSYFILVGLLRDGEVQLARDMTDNFIYQVEQYGKVLNANRTYYLTRSQPPFLTRMILGVYGHRPDPRWLRRAYAAVSAYHRFWTTEPHLTETGLSRYFDAGEGPAPEVVSSERDREGRTHYERVREFYRAQDVTDYREADYYDPARDELTASFYKGDRSMRESGFDPSHRFGPFGVDVIRYEPVCLNSLLYVMERDAAEIARLLRRPAEEARLWERRAGERARKVNGLMWDERAGLYFDYNFVERRRREYPFVTTFYPLWAGIATREQAARVAANLSVFERAGGLQTSAQRTGNQWDAPYGWAPMQFIAVEGLRRYGYEREAERLSVNFLSLVLKEFVEHDAVVEKYDVEARTSQLADGLRYGYTSNEIGFGWTNAAFTELYARLSPRARARVLELGGVGTR